MRSGKIIDVSKSSLVSLKAELSRKQEEVRQAKETDSYIKLPPKPRETVKSNSGVEERNQRDIELLPEEVDLLKKSREVLEVKTKLYNELKKGNLVSEDGKNRYLVDFEQKGNQSPMSDSNQPGVSQESHKSHAESSEDDFDLNESEWVEYTDCLGRTRKCHYTELDDMKRRDAEMAQLVLREKKDTTETPIDRPPELVSSDMEREKFRQKWEEQEKELLNKKDIHYEDILFDEARAHGVGYFKFSRDEEQRLKEQETLRKVREETEARQKEARLLRERREDQRQARLIAARQRQRARLGLPPLSQEEILKDMKSSSDVQKTEQPSAEPDIEGQSSAENLEISLKRTAHVRPWDVGKDPDSKNVMSQEEWIEKQRCERKNEFAPVYDSSIAAFDPTRLPPQIKKQKFSETSTSHASEEAIEEGLMFIRQQVEKERLPRPKLD